MAKTFHLTIAKIGETLFDGEVTAVTLPGSEGELTVLAQHEAFVTSLTEGLIRVQEESGTHQTFPVPTAGVLEVSNNQATVIL